jgi:hypothetical protein
MIRHLTRGTSPISTRRDRRARLAVEGLEVRETPTSLALASSLSLVLLNPQPLPPGSSPTAVYSPSNFSVYYPPNPC